MNSLSVKFEELLGAGIAGTRSLSGGCINEAFRVTLTDGRSFFVKQNRLDLADMFHAEAKGLSLLNEAAHELGIPKVVALWEDAPAGVASLVLDFVEQATPRGDYHHRFGRALAALHRHTHAFYGLDHNNYIGRLAQDNTRHSSWTTFFITRRLEPQMKQACDNGFFSPSIRSKFTNMCQKLTESIPDQPASLLHGDLWSGNVLCSADNKTVLIDPAVYYGHREAEIAFTRLFGGFSKAFYDAYNEAWPLEPGHLQRTDLFNVYPLLVHVNLFGGSYEAQVAEIIMRY